MEPIDDDHLPMIILAVGRFGRGQVRVTYDDAPRPTTPELEKAIAREWDRQVESAKGTQRVLYDGALLRYVRHRVTGEGDRAVFELTVGPTCYRDFVGTNLYNQRLLDRVGWERFANPIGTTATLITRDGLICYGRRSGRVAYHAGHVHTFGGALEGADRGADGRIDPFASLLRELREELNVGEQDLGNLLCTGLIRDREIHQPELLFEAKLHMTADELRRRWQSAEAKGEHDELVTLADQPDAIVPFIEPRSAKALRGGESCGPIAPVAVGALLLHGLGSWGRDWFDEAAKRLCR